MKEAAFNDTSLCGCLCIV